MNWTEKPCITANVFWRCARFWTEEETREKNNVEKENEKWKQYTTQNFETEVLKSAQPVLVDFYADWCGPCKMMAPVIEELAGMYEGRAKVGKLNVDLNEEIAMKYGVMSIPTLLVIKNGQVVGKMVGVQSKEAVMAALNQAL